MILHRFLKFTGKYILIGVLCGIFIIIATIIGESYLQVPPILAPAGVPPIYASSGKYYRNLQEAFNDLEYGTSLHIRPGYYFLNSLK